ncbi:MAG: hypothetical protein IPN29_13005 [Saprospiraceae bacterium]|nr:hypothetical protein [Saprospiraceae bacterium]
MLYGEVNAFKSLNGGSNWSKVNDWSEYYDNVQNKLHADIMVMREFPDPNGKNVVIIGHHGGISITYDYGVTTKNITLAGLNVSQYYDARSYPPDPDWIFAGSQDQGMQRGYSIDESIADFHQQISGDYGHISFTSNGRHMWIMYPGGGLKFFLNPLNQNGPNTDYQIEGGKESVWIPPIAVDPHTDEDIVYVAGGSSDATKTGAYIIEVKYNGSKLEAKDMPFDFSVSGGRISAIAISPVNAAIWFVATDNGYIYRSENSGQNFTLMQKMTSNAHYLYGSCILPSAIDPNVIYLSGSGYGSIAPVYVSNDGGTTFKEMRTGMPSTVAFNLALNVAEDRIYAATEAGPYIYVKEDQRWYPLSGEKTPNQTYWSVEYVPSLKTARFATYGRGVWDFKESEETTAINAVEEQSEIVLWPMPCGEF